MARNYYTEIIVERSELEMLDGKAYRWFDHVDMTASQVKNYLIYIPEDIDLFFYGRSFSGRGANIKLETFANPQFSSPGSLMDNRIFNRNSDYPKNNLAQIWQDPVVTSDGTLTDYDETSGSIDSSSAVKGSAGSESTQDFPRLMPKGTYILVRVTNLSSSNPAYYTYKLFWSEVEK